MTKYRKLEILQEANQVIFNTDDVPPLTTKPEIVNIELAITLSAALRHIKMLEKQMYY